MGGQGNFSDPRIGLFITQTPDLVTPRLAALLDHQLSLRTPEALPQDAAERWTLPVAERLVICQHWMFVSI
jgi:hypothetical protein